ncbi:MAG: ATP-binding cassette domain-containing protein, partial [Burkholderiaceae bacterium]|nr:ATP-binding cassette domain-containing protein [Burkholderiaceae bacterium]
MDKLLSLRNVEVIRDGCAILQSDDLHIPLTGITALIGPNGAGKTTLLRLIHGLIEPSIGRCERPFAPHESALVFHYTPMLKATVREHLTLLRDTDRTIRDEAIDEVLQSVGIAHLANNPAQRLSAGERQKLCFARTRLQNPKLVLLDEPTANLDPNASDDVEQMIAQLAKDGK